MPLEHDELRRLWMPVTIRVAWELVQERVAVDADVLADAREHVFRSLPAGVATADAEWLATLLTRDYVARRRDRAYARLALAEAVALPVPPDWRRRIEARLDALELGVFRLHYGAGTPLDQLEKPGEVDRAMLIGAREAIRDLVCQLDEGGELELDRLSEPDLDTFVARVANVADGGCPGPVGLMSEGGVLHAASCPRCSRAVRLVRAGRLDSRELFPHPVDLGGHLDLLAVLLHPDAGRHAGAVAAALGDEAIAVTGDLWLVPSPDLARIRAALADLCRRGRPPRHHLRLARVSGAGRLGRGVVLGPLPMRAIDRVRGSQWGEVGDLGSLPPPEPPPPPPSGYWGLAGAAGVAAIAAAFWALVAGDPGPTTRIEARFHPAPSGWSVRFDVPDEARVDVLVGRDGEVVHLAGRSLGTGKGAWATGEGDYALRAAGDWLCLVASPDGLPDLGALVGEARRAAPPGGVPELVEVVRSRDPRADVACSPVPVVADARR